MITLALIGLISGVAAGVSPCILPVLPVLLLSSQTATPDDAGTDRRRDLTPYLVVAGLATSFSVFTLLGTAALKALHLPDDLIRTAGLVALVLLGISLIVPAVDRLLERPFARLAFGPGAGNRKGFALGLALGAVYIPCAGPVLAVISVAGATSKIGGSTVVLTLAFALGTSVPLLAFALAGRRISDRISAFRSRQRGFRAASGVVMIALAVALTFNLTDALQRLVPDPASAAVDKLHPTKIIGDELGSEESHGLRSCAEYPADELRNCGKAPGIKGIASWINTPGGSAATLTGKVTLVDFWAYSCINCQRAIPHVEAWYQRYRDAGFEVVGVHTPEYAFEHSRSNVAAGARRLGITYPVALDNDYGTWNNFFNNSWPASYLIDATGNIRYVSIGEGDYATTEKLIRTLLEDAHPGEQLASSTDVPDATPDGELSPETYLGTARERYYLGTPDLEDGTRSYTFPTLDPDRHQFSLSGRWTASAERLTARTAARMRLNFEGRRVYLDVGGTGTMTATVDGRTTTYDVGGAPNIYTVFSSEQTQVKPIVFTLSPGLQVYSFTFG
ncbi:MAG: Redoxin domain protein [Marmoricola sp.]|nr:Redoxin domain protein [Marmoricola sp.]